MPYVMTGKSAGEEISSTYEGRHIDCQESDLVHPSHTDGFVDQGDPVLMGDNVVGVAFTSAAAATDIIAVDTEGIWALSVVGSDDSGNSSVARGDEIFINRTTGVLSKISNLATQRHFGVALSTLTGGTTGIVAVKVHFDPTVDAAKDIFNTVTSGQYGKSIYGYLAGGSSEGLSGYFEGHITAALTGHTYNLGSWVNVDSPSLLAAGFICTPYEGGVYAGGAQANARVVFAGQHMAVLNGAPASLHAWRLNSSQTITALIACANPGTSGVQPGKAGNHKYGVVPLLDVVGPGILYIDVFDTIV